MARIRARVLPLSEAILKSAVGYMLETPLYPALPDLAVTPCVFGVTHGW
jgi:hypothetical protein